MSFIDKSSLVIYNPDGSTEGADPRKLGRAALEAAGFGKQPLLKVIRAKCLDCSCGVVIEVTRCTATGCANWPYRMGTDPFTDRKGNPSALPRRKTAESPPLGDAGALPPRANPSAMPEPSTPNGPSVGNGGSVP